MTTTQWTITTIAALLGGGAMGAIINALIASHRNKIQPVGYKQEIIHIFRKGQHFPRLAKLTVVAHPLGAGDEESVNNLALTRLTITNKGNQDIDKFTFGISMLMNHRIVDIRMSEPNRHHRMSVQLSETQPTVNPDFFCEPFNRGDSYNVDIYFCYDGTLGEFEISSPHAIRFVEIGVTQKQIVELAWEIIKQYPPVPFLLRR